MMQQDLFTKSADPATNTPKRLTRGRHRLLSDFEVRLADSAADHDISAAMVHYARELVSLEDGLADDEQRALVVLVLASMVEGRNGSTRLPLETGQDSHLRGLVKTLLPARGGDQTVPGSMLNSSMLNNILDTLKSVLHQAKASTIIGGPGEYRPLIVDNGHLYHQRMLHYEDRLVDAVRRRLALPDAAVDLDEVRRALDETLADMPMVGQRPMQLNAEQKYGLLSAVCQPFTVISGGPGTGKTSIVVSLLRMLVRLGIQPDEIALAAPTGKAANRLGESIEAQLSTLGSKPDEPGLAGLDDPRTLHRLLGYSQARNEFYYHENNRLRQKVVVVDEASMIDLFLMERLVSAVEPGARLILLGDADQLPSVDSGAVFRDLVPDQIDTRTPWRELIDPAPAELISNEAISNEPTAAFSVRLETSYRMDPTSPAGSNILLAAQSLNRGDIDPLFGDDPLIDVRQTFDAVTQQGVEMLEPAEDAPTPDPGLMNGFVDGWYNQIVASLDGFRERIQQAFAFDGTRFSPEARAEISEIFDHFSRFRVLAITRVFATGSERLNAAFHARHMRHLGRTNTGRTNTGRTNTNALEVGEPIIMLKNDYERGLFNGDQGLVLDVQRTDGDTSHVQRMAVFERDGEFVPFSFGALRRHLEHAFALTVHKAQGSEFDTIAIVLPTEDIPLLTREILYTGMTRSKSSVVFVGERGRVEAAAKNPVRRFSGVSEKLGGKTVSRVEL
jgi:exodeoxyribonuclease V alpha subunit